MKWKIGKSALGGSIMIPPSKSHTIRALLIATLADGVSRIREPLMSGDGESALTAAVALGARVHREAHDITIEGIGKHFDGGDDTVYLGNSGTSMRLFTSAAALGSRRRTFDGDTSLRSRPMRPLLTALESLGATTDIISGNADIPFAIHGPIRGGAVRIDGRTSQFLSSLLLVAPLFEGDTTIVVDTLNERPYVEMTLWWLDKMGIRHIVSDDFREFTVAGRQSYAAIDQCIPGDFSSATFPAVAAAATGAEITLENVDFSDPQGDKEVFGILERMGVVVMRYGVSATVKPGDCLSGITIDLNNMPDALPALAVLGCLAEGTTSLVNVPQARIKECDRIAAMAEELTKMGAKVRQLEDGIAIERSRLRGTAVHGREDHRIVMALALAAMIAEGETVIDTAEAATVTYPTFVRDFRALGADIEEIE
ncbi:MAG: 3-phosphoshikimate 1-carboxyvinyltransferase [Chitinivibrionales bacterium]|nr:3-phosphoshikimate 1-carboxyvinyltransferase [Chitinivibrionales bacterium]MBD3357672.1 3-phosphoshikimate 1-carboxyvinyltransferase [Chitinivibrionales bacterium]